MQIIRRKVGKWAALLLHMPEKIPEKNLNYKKVSRKSIVLWEIIIFLIWAVIFVLALWIFTPFTWLWNTLIWALGVALILIEFLYLPMLYASTQYCITDKIIAYRHGVFFNQRQFMYRDRIVYVSVYNTPLTPLLGISSLVITAAGAKIRINFLNRRLAQQLAEELAPTPKDIY